MGRPKKSAPVLHEPEEESQETPDEEPARVLDEDEPDDAAEGNGTARGSKTELIRKALEAGYEKPALGVGYIKKEFGVDIDAKYYSIVKGKLGKVAPETEASKADAPEPKAAPARPLARSAQAPASTGMIPASLYDDLKQLRQMKDRYGDEFEKLVEAIG